MNTEPKVGFLYKVNAKYRWFDRERKQKNRDGYLQKLDIHVPEGSILNLLKVEEPLKFNYEFEQFWWYTFLFQGTKIVFVATQPTDFYNSFCLVEGQL